MMDKELKKLEKQREKAYHKFWGASAQFAEKFFPKFEYECGYASLSLTCGNGEIVITMPLMNNFATKTFDEPKIKVEAINATIEGNEVRNDFYKGVGVLSQKRVQKFLLEKIFPLTKEYQKLDREIWDNRE